MTIWRMRIVCWTTKSTNLNSECAIQIAFTLQQWLHEQSSLLGCSTLPALFYSKFRAHKQQFYIISKVNESLNTTYYFYLFNKIISRSAILFSHQVFIFRGKTFIKFCFILYKQINQMRFLYVFILQFLNKSTCFERPFLRHQEFMIYCILQLRTNRANVPVMHVYTVCTYSKPTNTCKCVSVYVLYSPYTAYMFRPLIFPSSGGCVTKDSDIEILLKFLTQNRDVKY